MNPTQRERALAAGALLATVAAGWMVLHRADGYDSIPASYAALQFMADAPHVSAVTLGDDDVLQVTITPSAGSASSISLERGIHGYEIDKGIDGMTVELEVMHTGVPEALMLTRASIPIARSLPYHVADFAYPTENLSEAALARSLEIANEAGIEADDDARVRTLKLAAHMHDVLDPYRGQPTARMRRLDGLGQLDEALGGRSKIYCANYAEIFALLGSAAGVPTRIVDVSGRQGEVLLGAHAFNECYIDDRQAWGYVDLTLGVALPENSDGRLLNGIDMQLSGRGRGDETIHRLSGGTYLSVPFSEESGRVGTFVSESATHTYLWASNDRFSTGERLHRLFVKPQPSFSLHNSGPGGLWILVFTYAAGAAWALLAAMRIHRHISRPSVTSSR